MVIFQYLQLLILMYWYNIRAQVREPTFPSRVWGCHWSCSKDFLLVGVPQEVDSETSIWVQAVYLGGAPKKHL